MYIAYRAKPALERCSYLELSEHLQAGLGSEGFRQLEDQIIYHMLSMEQAGEVRDRKL